MMRQLNTPVMFVVVLAGWLQADAVQAQIEIEVSSSAGAVMSGKQQLASVPKRTRLMVQQVQGEWLLVSVQTAEGAKQGWIHRKDVRQLFLPPKTPVEATVKIYKEDAEEAAAELGRWMESGQWPKAAAAAENLVRLYYRGLGSEDKHTGIAEVQLAFCCIQDNRHYEAEKFLLHAIKVLEKFDDSQDTVTLAQTALADLYRQQGEYAKAEPLSARAVEAIEAKSGPTHADMAYPLAIHGGVLTELGRYEQAESLLQRAQTIYAREGKPDLAENMLENLGVLYERMEQLDRALAAHEKALKLKEARLGPNDAELVTSLSGVAMVQQKRGETAASEALYRRGLRLLANSRSDDSTRVDLLRGLGTTLIDAGKVGEAEAVLLQALDLERSARGSDSLGTATIRWVLGRLYYALHQNEKAAQELAQSMSIFAVRVGRENRMFLGAAQAAGIVYKDLKRLDEAEKLLREIIETRKRRGESYWMPQVNLAGVYAEGDKLAQAETLYLQAIPQAEKEIGPDHPDLARSLALLAELYLSQKSPAKAEPVLLRSIQIIQRRMGNDHSNLAVPLRDLAGLQFATGRLAEATATFDRSRRIVHGYLHNSLPWFSEPEQLAALANERGPFAMALSLAFERPDDQAVVERTAQWMLNGKAVAYEVLAERTLMSRSATTPELAAVVRELEQVRQAMANRAAAAALQSSHVTNDEDLLVEREQALQKRLGELGGAQRSTARWVDLASVRQSIPKDGVLIEVGMIHRYDFQGPTHEQSADLRYLAWVIPAAGEGDVRFVELGQEGPITEAIKEYLKLSDTCAWQILQLGEQEAEQRMNAALEKVGQLLLKPLEKLIAQKRHWIISPDWYPWAVPWAALSLTKGRYVIEDHVISYRISGRKLVEDSRESATTTKGPAVVFADPDFELETGEKKAPAPNEGDFLPSRSAQIAGRVPRNWTRLPGTAEETTATLPELSEWLGGKPTVYLQREARETQFRQLKRPRALVMSTHGYFLEDQIESKSKPASKDADGPEGRHENGLLRCGLVLAGANRRPETADSQDDGILTGLEILATDLRGTEIVVLSACQTAQGVVVAGEGVAGLQQVFQLAGGRTVLATQWSIPDAETAELMTHFWHFMAQKQTKAEAMRNAQLAVIKNRREKGNAAHPYYWAAFTLSGDAN